MFKSAMRKIIPDYGYTAPSVEEVLFEELRTKYTPDISVLEEQAWQPVFVVDELKKDHVKHSLLGEDKHYAGPAYTQLKYRFWEKRNDPVQSPIPMKALDKENGFVRYFPPPARIKGELWYIRSQQMILLDTYKQNTVEFRRHRVTVILPYKPQVWMKDPYKDPDNTLSGFRGSMKLGNERVHLFRPWMYLGKATFWQPHLTAYDFTHVSLFKSDREWCQQFYHVKKS